MAQVNWEYCVLERMRFNVEPPKKGNEEAEEKEKTIAAYGIRFCDAKGSINNRMVYKTTTKNASDKTKASPFHQILGLLGGAGWEMVTITEEPDRLDMCTILSAYLKRPMVEGRAVNEPHFEF